jgi:hypothetical protein
MYEDLLTLLAHGRWFSPGTPASSTTKTSRHDLAEILLKVVLNTINPPPLSDLLQCMKIYSSTLRFITMYEDLLLRYQI